MISAPAMNDGLRRANNPQVDIGHFAAGKGNPAQHFALQDDGFRRHGDDFAGVTVAVLHFNLVGPQSADDEEKEREQTDGAELHTNELNSNRDRLQTGS